MEIERDKVRENRNNSDDNKSLEGNNLNQQD